MSNLLSATWKNNHGGARESKWTRGWTARRNRRIFIIVNTEVEVAVALPLIRGWSDGSGGSFWESRQTPSEEACAEGVFDVEEIRKMAMKGDQSGKLVNISRTRVKDISGAAPPWEFRRCVLWMFLLWEAFGWFRTFLLHPVLPQ